MNRINRRTSADGRVKPSPTEPADTVLAEAIIEKLGRDTRNVQRLLASIERALVAPPDDNIEWPSLFQKAPAPKSLAEVQALIVEAVAESSKALVKIRSEAAGDVVALQHEARAVGAANGAQWRDEREKLEAFLAGTDEPGVSKLSIVYSSNGSPTERIR